MTTAIKYLKEDTEVNHPTEGTLRYMGKATRTPYTKELKNPTTFIFWRPIDKNGKNQVDYTTTDGNQIVEVI